MWGKRKRRLDFENDEDFVERQASPTKFGTISNLSESFEEEKKNLEESNSIYFSESNSFERENKTSQGARC